MSTAESGVPARNRVKKKYVPAVTPRLRIVLITVFVLFALLAANSVYLAGITFLEYVTEQGLQDHFYQWMVFLHLTLGLLLLLPFMAFAYFHLVATRKRKNRTAVRVGYGLLVVCGVLLISGFLLFRIDGLPKLQDSQTRTLIYWAHVISPLMVVWLYIVHRLAGPPIKWRVGLSYAAIVGVVVGALVLLRLQDPRDYQAVGSPKSKDYFEPSLVRTRGGNFIPERTLMDDQYCLDCHADVHRDHYHSAHHFSSFNNPAYLMSVEETRRLSEERDGSVKASRFCAGCHDPVPFLSGKFDDPNFDIIKDPTAKAGITCVTCHSITSVGDEEGNVVGNADYSIEEPIHYPFAYSDNPVLKWINHQLIKAKPAFHKKMFLKPMHKSPDFCATCHKVHLPGELNDYKDWLRGQNSFDSYHLSGVSGHGLSSFYYPKVAEQNCNECHMPRKESDDFGAILNQLTGKTEVHNHLFPSANTAVAWWNEDEETIKAHQAYLKDVMRLDIFGIKEDAQISGQLHAPIGSQVPTLTPGRSYLIETVIRTAKMGHPFTQGTADSNEIWVELTAIENAEWDSEGRLVNGRVLGSTGGLDSKGEVDPWSHFINVFMLDRNGNRIDRRNAQDIFTPLYNRQIPPGAAQVSHFKLDVPADATGEITVVAKLNFRKFDWAYLKYIHDFHRDRKLPLRGVREDGIVINELPITKLAEDRVTFPVVAGPTAMVAAPVEEPRPAQKIDEWMRWNDYGIALMITANSVMARGELRQAEFAFQQVERLGRFDGPINLARLYESEGSLDLATEALSRANDFKGDGGEADAFPYWTHAWLTGLVNRQQGNLRAAAENLKLALEFTSPAAQARGFDFSQDFRVRNQLAQTLFDLAKQYPVEDEFRTALLDEAIAEYQKCLTLDSENEAAHYGLYLIYQVQGNLEKAAVHENLHRKYKLDDNARDVAIIAARQQYPAANHAAEAVVITELRADQTFSTSSQGYRLGEETSLESNVTRVREPFELEPESQP
jgi:tetratricopeptide (TPR) repeat protein